ncbi:MULTISPECIES: SseB family protein [unclassified Streptomyces]|uniref:SseB family protein n=1 Tax=unclassified Streptomyces TaxID=2593676 RepID=UPI0003666AD1|nr:MULTISPECIES: SseB family protein [unclassified Streptomyces]
MPLADEVVAFHEGRPNPAALIGEFRRTVVILPIADEAFLATDLDGIRWLYAFSDEDSLSRFAAGRGSDPATEWQYATVTGARILDVLIPAVEGPAGVALDAGSAQGMLFPPVSGIVPDHVAVDVDNGISAPSPAEAQGSTTHV